MFGSADVEKNFINIQQGISGSSSGQNIAPAQNQEYGDFILRNWETISEADMKRMNVRYSLYSFGAGRSSGNQFLYLFFYSQVL